MIDPRHANLSVTRPCALVGLARTTLYYQPAGVAAAVDGLGRYFGFYNCERPHQSLGYRTPQAVYLGLAQAERTVLCLRG